MICFPAVGGVDRKHGGAVAAMAVSRAVVAFMLHSQSAEDPGCVEEPALARLMFYPIPITHAPLYRETKFVITCYPYKKNAHSSPQCSPNGK